MSLLQNSNAIESGSYNINNSLRFRSSASANLSRTPSGTTRRIMTFSFWVKRGSVSADNYIINATTDATASSVIYFNNSNSGTLDVFLRDTSTNYSLTTTQVFRDPSAWYHIVVAIDTTKATASDRTKVYVNGSEVTSFLTASYIPQNTQLAFGNTVAHYIGGNASYLDGYLAEFYYVSGSQLTPSSFGETDTTTGVWKPKAYTGTYGSNGFYLKFSDIATTSGSNAGLGKDFSGNGNYWTTNNISVTSGTTYDAMTDSPTLSESASNYAVLSPIDSSGKTIAGANLNFSGSANGIVKASIGMSSGKWYCEVTNNVANDTMLGICTQSTAPTSAYLGTNATSWSYRSGGTKFTNASSSAYGASYTTNDIIGIAFDADAGSLTFYKNGTSQGVAFSGLAADTYVFAAGNNAATNDCSFNFGQRPFSYTPPTGYKALNAYNLPDSTIKKGNSYIGTTLYQGSGTTTSYTNDGLFKPDLVWLKGRSAAKDHSLYDSVRGVTKRLRSSATDAENTVANGLTAFNSDGFTLGSDNNDNASASTYVAWQWKAGQGTTSSNTSGSITSTVSVNATAGFSIVTYTGTGANATVGHGLGVAPKMVIVKSRSSVLLWPVWHTSLASTEYLTLNATSAKTTGAPTVWNSTTPTSSVFSIGSATGVNTNGATYVAYCWAEIAGFSKFGSYTGNGSANGPFVYLGFRPKYVIIKCSSAATYNWNTYDSARDLYNTTDDILQANTSSAEFTNDTANPLDFLSNGFKIRGSNAANNGSGATFIYAAFAENPFKNSLAR